MAMRALQQRIVDRDELDDSDDDGIMPGAPSAEEHLSFAEKLALRKEQRRALEDTEFDDAELAEPPPPREADALPPLAASAPSPVFGSVAGAELAQFEEWASELAPAAGASVDEHLEPLVVAVLLPPPRVLSREESLAEAHSTTGFDDALDSGHPSILYGRPP